MLPFVPEEVELPSPLPFEGIQLEKQPSNRYKSKIDASSILAEADKTLAKNNPEAYKILLLALVCGLRISEIDFLLWSSFDFKNGVLKVRDYEFKKLKSEDSAGDLYLSSELSALFQSFYKMRVSEFVIPTRVRT